MVRTMSRKIMTLEELAATSAKVGKRVNEHTDRAANSVKETVAKSAKRVNDHTTAQADATRKHSDDNHAATQRVIRDEAEATRRALGNYMALPEIIIGAILGIIAGLAMWFAEKGVIMKPISYDAVGNVTAYGTDTFMVVLLAIVLGIFVFFCASSLIHWIRNRH